MNRRQLLAATGTAIGSTAIGYTALTQLSQPTLAASLTAGDVGVTTDDGQITEITAAPSLTIGFDGFDQPIDQFEIGLETKTASESSFQPADASSNNGYVALAQLNSASTSGTRDVTLADIALRSGSNTEALDADTDGDSNSTDVTLKVVVQATDSTTTGDSYQGNVIRATASATATYTVSVTNRSASISTTGSANTGITK